MAIITSSQLSSSCTHLFYSFLEEYDFTGKEIHVFVCHGGSGAAGTISNIQSLQSGASVDTNPLTLYWTDVENAENLVMNWLN